MAQESFSTSTDSGTIEQLFKSPGNIKTNLFNIFLTAGDLVSRVKYAKGAFHI